jgi:hypothetical protein
MQRSERASHFIARAIVGPATKYTIQPASPSNLWQDMNPVDFKTPAPAGLVEVVMRKILPLPGLELLLPCRRARRQQLY